MRAKKWWMLLVVLMMALPLCVPVSAEEEIPPTSGTCGENSWWWVDDRTKTLYISGTGSATIPTAASVIGSSSSGNHFIQVTYLNSLFTSDVWYRNNIKKLVVEEGITEIGYGSFYGCDSITEVQFPSTLKTIHTYAFYGLTALEELTLPEGVEMVGARAFQYCYNLRELSLPATLTAMGTNTFDSGKLQTVRYAGSKAEWEQIYGTGMAFDKDHVVTLICAGDPIPVGGFSDVYERNYFADSVLWAVEERITEGTSKTTFSPNATCTRAQILTFLWRAAGSPQPEGENPFADVGEADYYLQPAVWACEQGLVSGGVLDGGQPCTRADVVTYLWKLAGAPEVGTHGFSDVPAEGDRAQAVAWAVEKGITSGTGTGRFSPDAACTRAQIVTFLYRDFGQDR